MTDLVQSVLVAGAAIVVLTAVIMLYRVAVGPTTYDRVIGVNLIGTSTVMVLVLLSAALDRPEYLDIAIVYALLNFVLSLVVGRFTYDSSGVEWQ